MNETATLFLTLLAGASLGALFFGGLWWTVQKGVQSENPALWFFSSLLLRTGLVLGAFCFISQGKWSRLAMCLLGFIIARVIVIKGLPRTPAEEMISRQKGTPDAP